MGRRKVALANGCHYHVFNKSIAGFEIFRFREEYERARDAFRYYRTARARLSYSHALREEKTREADFHGPARVKVIAYCLMPTHFHFFLEQTVRDGISDFLQNFSHSYGAYFNKKSERLGPLWQSRFKSVLVEDDAYALHLARYIHLNPTTAGLVKNPENWEYSSYQEYLRRPLEEPLCEFRGIMDQTPAVIRKFTEDRADYQQSLQVIKRYLLD